ncbi:hypothetical protein [Streptomyces tropicalis]|uniref:Secreted protein n=1 Tax=Streptomyces tropicalis TaxID=3034234 RepID=A0ABT6A2G4_9ACTN|nr:hypothetical protein [Streptomyces tropicalis]MDF3298838.1 hypothetical protein [Streptomyces tropicalis]
MTRSHAITAAVAAAAALTATGLTYAVAAPALPAAPVVAQSVPVQAPMGGDNNNNNNNQGKGNEGKGNEGNNHGQRHFEEGWISINERSYSAHPGGCITVVSGLGSRSLNVRNDSRRTVEVFRGATCDNGAPIATVGPWSSSNGVHPGCTRGVKVEDGVVGSFRVVDGWDGRGGRDGDRGGDDW